MKNIIIAGFAAVLCLAACRPTTAVKNVVKSPAGNSTDVRAPQTDSEFFLAIAKPATFKQIKISSKIDVQTGTFVPTADATTYIENGQKIWMNISAAFLNIARGIANPQGVKGYEKIGRNYIDSDFSYLNKLLNVNFINYKALQNLLTGRTFLAVEPDGYVLTKNSGGFLLTTAAPKTITQDGVSRSYIAKLQYSPSFDLMQASVQDTNSADVLQVFYSDRVQIGGESLPQNVKIVLKGSKQGQINIQNTKFDLSAMETPYTVPANYTKKDVR